MFDIGLPWWFGIIFWLYLFMVYFGIGAVLGLIVAYIVMLIWQRPEKKPGNREIRASILVACALLGGFVNLVVADVLLS